MSKQEILDCAVEHYAATSKPIVLLKINGTFDNPRTKFKWSAQHLKI